MRMMEPPSFRSGNAFCTVNSVPLTLMLNNLSKCSSVTDPKGTNSPTPALARSGDDLVKDDQGRPDWQRLPERQKHCCHFL